MTEYKLLINGELVNSSAGQTVEDIGPATGEPIARVPQSTLEDVERAVAAAREAFDDGRWSGLPHGARAAALEKLATMIEAHASELDRQPAFLCRCCASPCRRSRQRVQRRSYQHHSPRACWRRRLASSMELSFHDGGLEDWPGPGCRQHRRPQAIGRDAAHHAQTG